MCGAPSLPGGARWAGPTTPIQNPIPNYYVGHISGRDTTFTHLVGSAIANTDYLFQVNTPQFKWVDLSLLQLAGRDENFFEWSAADISITQAALNVRPTDKLRAQLMYNASLYTFNAKAGAYTSMAASQSNQLQLSGLFSYQPVPGTVAFIGYGNNLNEAEDFRFALRRVADSFFVKFSYLFRVQ